MSKENKLQKIASKIYKNPVTQATLVAVDTLPIIGVFSAAGRKGMEQVYANAIEERREAYLDELEMGGFITTDMLETEEFIHSVFLTYSAAMRTFHRNKIRRFARILITGIEKDELASDNFEYYFRLLESLSEREIDVLITLRNLENTYAQQTQKEIKKRRNSFLLGENNQNITLDITRFVWEEFIKTVTNKYQISVEQLLAYLERLTNLGLYGEKQILMHETNKHYSLGTASILFDDFSEWIKLEDDKPAIES